MPRDIRKDEFSLLREEVSMRDINRDPLLSFRLQPIEEKSRIYATTRRTVGLGIGFQRGKNIGGEESGIKQKSPNECALAIIHIAAREESHELLLFVSGEEVLNICR